jgi:indolepyruvate decarboxylase
MNLVESLLHALKANGARQIFGIPGDFALPYFKHHRGIQDPAALHALARAGRGIRGRCVGEDRWQSLGVAAVTYGAGRTQHDQLNRRGLRRESRPWSCSPAGRARGSRVRGCCLHHQAKSLDSQYQHLRGDHLRPARASTTPRARRPTSRACSASCLKPLGARCTSRSRATWSNVSCAPVVPALAAAADFDAGRARRLRRRGVGNASPAREAPGADDRRRGAPLPAGGEGGATSRAGSAIPVVTCFMGRGLLADSGGAPARRHLHGRGGPARGDRSSSRSSDGLCMLGVILCGHQLRGLGEEDRHEEDASSRLQRPTCAIGYHAYSHDIPLAALVERPPRAHCRTREKTAGR